MSYRVYVTDHVFQDFDAEEALLKPIGAELIVLQCKTTRELVEKAWDADALLNTFLGPIDGTVMDAMQNLKVIVRYGTGIDTIDLAAATARSIPVANVSDYAVDEVSDHAVALLLNLVRKIDLTHHQIKQHLNYSLDDIRPFLPLRGSVAAIIGFGKIGRQIARKLNAFGLELYFYDPFIAEDFTEGSLLVKKADLDEIYDKSHIIILQAPLVKENHHLLDHDAFARMKQKPYIINTARGPLIDNNALADALTGNRISGAALDVVEDMPPVSQDHRLLKFDQVLLTPHTGWLSQRSVFKLKQGAAAEVARVLGAGLSPASLLNPPFKHLNG